MEQHSPLQDTIIKCLHYYGIAKVGLNTVRGLGMALIVLWSFVLVWTFIGFPFNHNLMTALTVVAI